MIGDWKIVPCISHWNHARCAQSYRTGTNSKSCDRSDEPKAGCAGSVLNILQIDKFNHQVEIERGILEEECSQMLSDFFKELRRRKKGDKEHGKD